MAALTRGGRGDGGSVICLVRHGETEANRLSTRQGWSDTGLDDTGIMQAQKVAGWALGKGVKSIVSSDLVRATQTAEPIALMLGLPVETSPSWRERLYGREMDWAFVLRVRNAWEKIHDHTLVVTHLGVIRALTMLTVRNCDIVISCKPHQFNVIEFHKLK